MTITLTESTVYIGVTVLLVGLQLYQQFIIRNLQKDIKRLWEQAATSAIVLYSKVGDLEKQVKDKE
jgi:hypothetical protein